MNVLKIHQPIAIFVRKKNTCAAPYTVSLLIKRASYLALLKKVNQQRKHDHTDYL